MEKPLSILYIDDDEDDISIFREALHRIGASISFHPFDNGFDALNYLEQTNVLPDYLFLDINMPKMNGKEILRYLKQNHRLRVIPVIMFTTSNFEHEVKEFYKEGASGFIHKGFSLDEIKGDIAGVLKINS